MYFFFNENKIRKVRRRPTICRGLVGCESKIARDSSSALQVKATIVRYALVLFRSSSCQFVGRTDCYL